jgi:hypothetical protein
MALFPKNEIHALQIQAGVLGRKTGHNFEDAIAVQINSYSYPIVISMVHAGHIFIGNPTRYLIQYIGNKLNINHIESCRAIATGSLATSEAGKKWLSINGIEVSRCKSDLIITIDSIGSTISLGVSTKQCNNATPTNAQLYFTTARCFSNLLRSNNINVSDSAINAMQQFCGDNGFRPLDSKHTLCDRNIDPRRFFWEEIDPIGKAEWEHIFSTYQDDITRLLFQKAYLGDPFIPEFLLHKTKIAPMWEMTEVAIYTIDEIVTLSRQYGGFRKKEYKVIKGSYKDPVGASPHEAPRFGIIQMQRGGQAQHPEQLQFNLEAGYFYKI